MTDFKALELKAYQIRKNILIFIGINHRGHFGGSFSLAEIMATFILLQNEVPSKESALNFMVSMTNTGRAQMN